MLSERGGRIFAMDERYCVDNGAMIAWAGWLEFQTNGPTPFRETNVVQRFRTDEVEVGWKGE